MSYGVFAEYYDLFTSNVDYKQYAERIDDIVMSLGLKRGSLVDLGCGTASLDLELSCLGYSVTGIDLSCDMLTAAASKIYAQGTHITLINQDMTELKLPNKTDVIISTLDGLNHLDSLASVKKVFAGVKKYLKNGGVFIFDMNTPFKHKNVLKDNHFIFDTEEAYLGWQNEFDAQLCKVDITLDFFIPEDDGSYSRFTEEFSEIAYDTDIIVSSLRDEGLEALYLFDGLTIESPTETTQRILYVVRHIM